MLKRLRKIASVVRLLLTDKPLKQLLDNSDSTSDIVAATSLVCFTTANPIYHQVLCRLLENGFKTQNLTVIDQEKLGKMLLILDIAKEAYKLYGKTEFLGAYYALGEALSQHYQEELPHNLH